MADWTATSDYRGGILGWNAFVQPLGSVTRPAMEIELFLKDYSIPVRKKQITEINTIDNYDPVGQKNTNVQAIFEGSPELSSTTVSGFVKTHIIGYIEATHTSSDTPPGYNVPLWEGYYLPFDKNNNPVWNLVNMTYAEIVGMYLAGQMNLTAGGAYQRKDPDYFISPYGQKYVNPVILTWEVSAVSESPGKQSVSSQIALES